MTSKSRRDTPTRPGTPAVTDAGLPQVTPDGLEDQDAAAELVLYQALRADMDALSSARDEAREQTSALGKGAQAVLASLSPEDRASIEAWVGMRDKLQQAQGGLNALKPVAAKVHDMEAMLGRERRRRLDITRIKGELEKLLGRRRQGRQGPGGRQGRPESKSEAGGDYSSREYRPLR